MSYMHLTSEIRQRTEPKENRRKEKLEINETENKDTIERFNKGGK